VQYRRLSVSPSRFQDSVGEYHKAPKNGPVVSHKVRLREPPFCATYRWAARVGQRPPPLPTAPPTPTDAPTTAENLVSYLSGIGCRDADGDKPRPYGLRPRLYDI
jgi:hypothetical protein